MPQSPAKTSAAVRRLASRITIVIAALATVAGVSVAAPATASAQYAATSSTDVAADANHALWLLVRWEDTADLADYTAYVQARLEASARSTAVELGLSAPRDRRRVGCRGACPSSTCCCRRCRRSACRIARGCRSRAAGFDCSGLVLFAYGEAGIGLPRSSRDQIRAAAQIDRADLEPGDLVYYPGHISMYLGDDFVIHSPQPGQEVEVREMFDRSLRFGDAIDAQP